MNPNDSSLEKLREAFESHMSREFPADSTDEEISLLHASLAERDGHVSGIVSSILKGGFVDPGILKKDSQLERNLRGFLAKKTGQELTLVQGYLDYLNALDELLDLSSSTLGSNRE